MLTATYKYFCNNRENLLLPIQMQLSEKPKTGVEITDFQMPDKMSGTIKYLPDILKTH